MNILYKLFRQDPNSREGIITTTSLLGVIINLLLSAVKLFIGVMASSIAIISEGINGATDVLSSLLAMLGAKLSKKHPDDKHPFGYGRIEYLTGLVVAVMILVSGVEVLISSVKLMIHPEELQISYLSLMIVAVSAVVKFFLGIYTVRMGKKADSGALVGVGKECRNDSFASAITILTAVIFLLWNFSVDAYAGILIAALILKAGVELLLETISEILGRPGEKELALTLYNEIRSTEGVVNVADMMLHNYGPESYSGSVNVEIDHKKTVGEIYAILHQLQLRIMHEYKVTMVFGIYAVDNDREDIKLIRQNIGNYVKKNDHIKGFHALYLDPDTGVLYVDFIVDYALRDWEALRADFTEYVAELYPGKGLELTIETEFV